MEAFKFGPPFSLLDFQVELQHDDGVHVFVRVSAAFAERESGDLRRARFTKRLAYGELDRPALLASLREVLRSFILHELDESIVVDGARVFDPHDPGSSAADIAALQAQLELLASSSPFANPEVMAMTCEAKLLPKAELEEAMEPLSADAESRVCGHIAALATEAAKVPALEAWREAMLSALATGLDYTPTAAEAPNRLRGIITDAAAAEQRAVDAAAEGDASMSRVAEINAALDDVFSKVVEERRARDQKVDELRSEVEQALSVERHALDALYHAVRAGRQGRAMESVLGSVERVVKARAISQPQPAPAQVSEDAVLAEAERGYKQSKAEGMSSAVAREHGVIAALALRPTTTPPALVDAVGRVLPALAHVERVADGRVAQARADLLEAVASLRAAYDAARAAAPEAPELVAAVAPLAEEIRKVESGPRSIVPPWQDFDWNLQLRSVDWVAIRVAYDAARARHATREQPPADTTPIAPPPQRPRTMTPVPAVPALTDAPSAPEVVWEAPGSIRVVGPRGAEHAEARGLDGEWYELNVGPWPYLLARALAEAVRELDSRLRAYPRLVDSVRTALGHLRASPTGRVGEAITMLSEALTGVPHA
ncbi:hypothetical protein [Myxococcus sp. AS-1-15]|uniref:hypothetical protein n=1 Tax=Myxococcus sp. AS-1-15 TaxID=2874600 RepID=UPI001CC1BEDA|nr:hypothetical protein [Myxococcus sp. AS-1-15]MBZ4398650.1 hypothetical protein [Myxococcus sp. AS-1-15]